jgi:hypothetical protein
MIKLLKEIWELWVDFHNEMCKGEICVVAYPGVPFVFYVYDYTEVAEHESKKETVG